MIYFDFQRLMAAELGLRWLQQRWRNVEKGNFLEVEPEGLDDCSNVGQRVGEIKREAVVRKGRSSEVTHRFES